MKTYLGLQRGDSHTNYCEDFLMAMPLDEELFIGMVSDGCSSGRHAHFASALQCKLMRKIILSTYMGGEYTLEELSLTLLKKWIAELRQFRLDYFLQVTDLVATFNFLIYNKLTNQVYITTLGDGAVLLNETLHEIDQNNRPDYPAYHLDDDPDLLALYLTENTFTMMNPSQVAIASDGVFSFHYTQKNHQIPESKFAEFLLADTSFKEHENMIQRKINIVESKYKAFAYDDIAVIRLIFDENFVWKVDFSE